MTLRNKTLLLLAISLGVMLTSNQQSLAQVNPHAKAGLKGGLNAGDLNVNDIAGGNSRLGFHAGVYCQPVATEFFALQLELFYSTYGSTMMYAAPAYHTVQYDLEYIDLPVLAVFKVGRVLEFQAGGYAGYLLNAQIKYHGDLARGNNVIDRNELKSFDYGFAGGIGANFGSFQAGVRYNYGFVKLAGNDEAKRLLGDSRNSLMQIFLAVNLSRAENGQRGYVRRRPTSVYPN